MTKRLNALKVRQNLGQVLNEAYYQGQSVIVERAQKPMAAIIPMEEFLIWQKRKEQIFQIIQDAAGRVGLSEKKALELVNEAREKMV